MEPKIAINWLAILACVVAAMVIGFLWYGPLFGKRWAALMGFPPDFKPAPGQMRRSLLLALVGAFLIAFCLAHNAAVWHSSTWNAGPDGPPLMYAWPAGFFTWLGFFVPVLFGQVAWEGKPWSLFAINAGYWFVQLQAMGFILAFWR